MRILMEIMKYITLMFTMVMSIYLGIVISQCEFPNAVLTVLQLTVLSLIIQAYEYMLGDY